MATRKIKDAKDLSTNELIYFKGHAKATYMSDGRTVEDAINEIPDEGVEGPAGADGVSITSVVQTTTSTADGGTNVVTVTLSNGTKSTFNIKNGSKGSNGTNGTNGKDGADGEDGATFTPSVDADGNLSWSNNKGLANPATVNIKGPKGDSGEGGGAGDTSVFFLPFTKDDVVYRSGVPISEEQKDAIKEAAMQNKIIALPEAINSADTSGYTIVSYRFYNYDDTWSFYFDFNYESSNYSQGIQYDDQYLKWQRFVVTHLAPHIERVTMDVDGYASVDSSEKDNVIFIIEGECRYLQIVEVGYDYGMTVRFFTGEDCVVDAWGNWANGVIPTIEPYTAYELSAVYGVDYNPCMILTPFKYVE